MYTTADGITVALFSVLVGLFAAMGVRAWLRSRVTPAELERRRRSILHSAGKLGDANLLEIREDVLVYSYAVRGVEYTTSQDISQLKTFLPGDVASFAHISVKYDPRNPANSVVLTEDWCGLRDK